MKYGIQLKIQNRKLCHILDKVWIQILGSLKVMQFRGVSFKKNNMKLQMMSVNNDLIYFGRDSCRRGVWSVSSVGFVVDLLHLTYMHTCGEKQIICPFQWGETTFKKRLPLSLATHQWEWAHRPTGVSSMMYVIVPVFTFYLPKWICSTCVTSFILETPNTL